MQRSRRLIQSPWYQVMWGDRFRLLEDENMKTRYSNSETGFRASDFVGGGTGDRGDLDIIDDPLEVKSGDSEQMLLRASRWRRRGRFCGPRPVSALSNIRDGVAHFDPLSENRAEHRYRRRWPRG